MSQEIIELELKELTLWTENPRDPIRPTAKDQDIVDKALQDTSSKWTLPKLAKDMGAYYDFSELPTVVFHGKKPVVYDGNRRIILGKIKHGLVTVDNYDIDSIPEFPSKIPCNVCSQDIALRNVLRKHGDSGSWQPLERDLFLHKFMKQPKTPFLIIDDSTGLISARPDLNQVFVKNEIFKEETLNELGFEVKSGKLYTSHSEKQATAILSDIAEKVQKKKITTRINRGNVLAVLDRKNQQIIDKNRDNTTSPVNIKFTSIPSNNSKTLRLARRKTKKESELFGGKLYLKPGDVSDLYRDIADLYDYFIQHKAVLSDSFPSLIRMALRLLVETAAKDKGKTMDKYLSSFFSTAKANLTQDTKTLLSTQSVSEITIVQLLHTGAHKYKSTSNIHQTIAISIIVGEIIKITHGHES